jgi:hypothetical protein
MNSTPYSARVRREDMAQLLRSMTRAALAAGLDDQ